MATIRIGAVLVLSLALHADALGQPQTPTPTPKPAPVEPRPLPLGPVGMDTVPLRVQVTLATYQGEKKLSSVPYTLSVNAAKGGTFTGPPAQMRMGVKVPVPAMAPSTIDGKPINISGGPVVYQDIGTNIDCAAIAMEGGRFQLYISIEDQSFANTPAGSRPGEPPVIRSFRLSNQVTLREGETAQFTAATDRISGEVVRAEVTVNAVK